MTKEFTTLSEKIHYLPSKGVCVLLSDDVKEFIKLLKRKKITLIHSGDEGTSCFVEAVRVEEIDELAGEELK